MFLKTKKPHILPQHHPRRESCFPLEQLLNVFVFVFVFHLASICQVPIA